jgi:hypothetical protein
LENNAASGNCGATKILPLGMLNTNLQKLVTVAQKPERLIIGLMSGTSLDGLDIALCRFKGSGFQTRFELLKFTTVPYTEAFKQDVRMVFAKQQVSLEKLCLLNASIGSLHAEMILQALSGWNYSVEDIDVVASHGQTIITRRNDCTGRRVIQTPLYKLVMAIYCGKNGHHYHQRFPAKACIGWW